MASAFHQNASALSRGSATCADWNALMCGDSPVLAIFVDGRMCAVCQQMSAQPKDWIGLHLRYGGLTGRSMFSAWLWRTARSPITGRLVCVGLWRACDDCLHDFVQAPVCGSNTSKLSFVCYTRSSAAEPAR